MLKTSVVNTLIILDVLSRSKRHWHCARQVQEDVSKLYFRELNFRTVQKYIKDMTETGLLVRHPEDKGQNIRYALKGAINVNLISWSLRP